MEINEGLSFRVYGFSQGLVVGIVCKIMGNGIIYGKAKVVELMTKVNRIFIGSLKFTPPKCCKRQDQTHGLNIFKLNFHPLIHLLT